MNLLLAMILLSPHQASQPASAPMVSGPNSNRVDYVIASQLNGQKLIRWHGLIWATNAAALTIVDVTNSPMAPKANVAVSWQDQTTLLTTTDLTGGWREVILKTFLETIKEKFKIEHIVLEDSLMKFGFGRSSASVLGLLNKFNGIAWWTLYQVFGIKPVLLGPLQSRKILGILIAKGDDTKLAIVKYVMKSEPTFEVKMTPGGNFVPGCDDRADSVVLGRALEKILEFPELLVPKPKKARRSKKR